MLMNARKHVQYDTNNLSVWNSILKTFEYFWHWKTSFSTTYTSIFVKFWPRKIAISKTIYLD